MSRRLSTAYGKQVDQLVRKAFLAVEATSNDERELAN